MELWRMICGTAAGAVIVVCLVWTVGSCFGLFSVWRKVSRQSPENRSMGRAHTLNVIGLGGITEAKILLPEGPAQWTAVGVAAVFVVLGVCLVIAAENRLRRSTPAERS